MGKNKFLFKIVTILLAILAIQNVTYALPTITSDDSQTFNKNDTSTQLRNITITEDDEFVYITTGELKITIPDSIQILFDTKRTTEEILLYGTAVTHGKVAEKPTISFENGDKTLIIPVLENFDLNDNVVIKKVFVEGFNQTTTQSAYLKLQINDEETKYTNNKELNIYQSLIQDTHEPDSPTDIEVQNDENGVKLTWADPTDLDLQLIQIFRGKNNSPVNGIPYAEIVAGVEEYIDTDAEEGETVKYQLKATDGLNSSKLTEEISIVVESEKLPDEEADSGEIEEGVPEEENSEENENSEEEEGTETNEKNFCSAEYTPVCGTDGVTYPNQCTADKSEIGIAYKGECEEETDEEPEPTPINFEDISRHWAQEAINELAQKSIVTGQSKGIFNPNGNLNRAEAAAILYRILGMGSEEPEVPTKEPFLDVELDKWYAGYIDELHTLNLVSGDPEGTYRPSDNINRAEFLKLATTVYYYKADESEKAVIDALKEGEVTKNYIDLQSAWYTPFVTAATEKGFVSGKTCGDFKCFDAEASITRAEATTILYNMFY